MALADTLKLLLQGVQDKQSALDRLATTPIQQGLRNPGQTPGQLLTNPTPNQNRAMLEITGGMLDRDRSAPPIRGINQGFRNGIDLLRQLRTEDADRATAGAAIATRGAQDQLDAAVKLGSAEALGGGGVGTGAGISKEQFSRENTLRDEFQAITKDYRKQQEAFGRIQASTQNPTPAGDLALIFNYMKLLDPGSVVRESEFATAAASGSFGERIKAMVAMVQRGERLSPAMRRDFMARSAQLYEEATAGYKHRQNEYNTLSQGYGLTPGSVVSSGPQYAPEDYSDLTADLPAGHTESGYRFLGGNPADPKAWERI